MSGFNNQVVGGGGVLVRDVIESQGFNEATQTGWAIFKNGSAFFFAITSASTFTVHNAFGAVVMEVTNQGFFQYFDTGSAVQGALILAIASQAGTDPVTGHNYNAGMNGIDPFFGDTITVLGANILLGQVQYTSNGQVTSRTGTGTVGPFTLVNAPEQGVLNHLQMLLFGAWSSGFVLPGFVIGFAAGSNVINRQTPYSMEVQATDGNVYLPLIGQYQATGQNVTTTLQNINGWSGISHNNSPYRVNGILTCVKTTAGTVTITLQDPGVAPTQVRVKIRSTNTATPVDYLDAVLTNTSASATSASIPNGTTFTIEVNGSVNFNATGVFGFEASTSAGTFAVNQGGPLTTGQGLSSGSPAGASSMSFPSSDLLTIQQALALFAPAGVVQGYQGGQNYAAGAIVLNAGTVYYANNAISNSPVTFNAAQWTAI